MKSFTDCVIHGHRTARERSAAVVAEAQASAAASGRMT
jgi:hypothetical protein